MSVTPDVSKLNGWLKASAESNIQAMFVTLEVFQLDMSALKLRKLLKRLLMSVTPETPQSAMGPYTATAADAFKLNLTTADIRSTLVVNS